MIDIKAIILAAGKGTRMQAYSKGAPKCLIPIGKETLLTREIRMLGERGFGKADILVVGGYKYEMLNNCGATLIHNAEYDRTDNSYSLALALEKVKDEDVLVMDADLVFDDTVLDAALSDRRPNLVLTKESADMSESTGILTRDDGTVKAIGKELLNSGYVYISIFKFGHETVSDFLEALTKEKSLKTWYTTALTELMQKYPFYNLTISGKWHEVDFPEDYMETLEMFGLGGRESCMQ